MSSFTGGQFNAAERIYMVKKMKREVMAEMESFLLSR
jgi:hypothetical protein